MKIRSAYSGARRSAEAVPSGPGRVKQEFKKEVNINEIVGRMKRGIQPPPWMTSKTPRYGDFSSMPASFSEAFEIVAAAQDAFESLPVEFRREIDHDPRNLDRAPRELFERFGLLKAPEVSERPQGASGAPATQRVQGDRDLPATGRPGPNKKVPAKDPGSSSDED